MLKTKITEATKAAHWKLFCFLFPKTADRFVQLEFRDHLYGIQVHAMEKFIVNLERILENERREFLLFKMGAKNELRQCYNHIASLTLPTIVEAEVVGEA